MTGLVFAPPAMAHGAFMQPGSRTFLCWEDGLTSTGEIDPQNPACRAAVAQSGANSLYNWFAVLRSDGAGRTRGFVPDGQLCSGGNPNYTGFDLPSADWPVTHLTSGADFEFRYNKWAAHPGSFHLYVTKDGWDPTKPLTWDEMEADPFLIADHPADTGPVGSVDGYYYWTAKLPANKTGRHIIYSVWSRSDSNETFYGCSDVVFDGGNGEVTGVGEAGPPGSTPCTASLAVTNAWPGGFQAEATVTNPNTDPIDGWTVSWVLPSGQTINSLWNGTLTVEGDLATVRNADWNRAIAAGASTTFGLVVSGPSTVPTLSCTSP
jgi:chitin-binding protein